MCNEKISEIMYNEKFDKIINFMIIKLGVILDDYKQEDIQYNRDFGYATWQTKRVRSIDDYKDRMKI